MLKFLKSNPRSNLIIITPIGGENDKKPNGKESASVSSLMLPQRKWGSSVNEESSSPKENRPIGPTRFNRHGSSSDSDSNSESESDRSDSYSNDTVLQDEPSRNFSGLTPEENTEDEPIAAQKKTSDHRLNFENIDSNLPSDNFLQRKSDNFHDVEKNVCSNSSKNERKSDITVSRNNVTELKKEYANDQYNSASACNEHSVRTKDNSSIHSKNVQCITLIANGGFHSRKDDFSRKSIFLENCSCKNCEYPLDNKSGNILAKKDTRNQLNNLSEDDLRINLQKSGRELKSNKTYSSQIENESSHFHTVEQSRNHIHQRQSEKLKHHDNHSLHKSRERRFHGVDKSRSSNSSPEDHAHSTSPFQQNSQQTDFRVNQHPKRKHTSSSDRSYKRSCSRSPTQQSAVYDHSHRRYSGSSSSSSSSSGSNQQIRSISSVVRTVDSKVNGIGSVDKHPVPSSKSNYVATSKRERHSDEKPKLVSSAVQSSTFGGSRNNATGGNKRVPVHMRLGSFPLKRVIQMPKDVEAAFVNSSSDEDDGKGKKIQSRAIAMQQVLHFPLTIFSTGNSDIYYALFTLCKYKLCLQIS
ncbi:hypothetical protein CEXT_510351 [Caerostris extrusa]|uniref:Uncharacterized protein n=1 Tax=Caerostris extrusa TaxID=172846 RepID=A0AAV4NSY9_CAEEX|nr:hypothetical protein CEXT_510351 [Caerostris extrusa]